MRKVKTRIKTDRFHGDGREGGSLLYVIFFITLLSVFACGFMAVSRYHIKMALKNRAYMEARLTTHMIHNSFCEAVSKGESDALRLLWNQYEGDLEDEEAEENENEDIPETEGAGADGITKLDADEIQDTNERQDADERQDTDLDLEDREYITEGTGSYTDEKGEPCERAYPPEIRTCGRKSLCGYMDENIRFFHAFRRRSSFTGYPIGPDTR